MSQTALTLQPITGVDFSQQLPTINTVIHFLPTAHP